MRKRTLISIIITVVCIALTNRLWFNIKPLQISFIAQGSGKTKFEFFLNKKDNNDFKKVKYGIVNANLDDNDFIELFINRVRGAKRVKITASGNFTPSPKPKTLILSEFTARYDKYKLDDLKAFSAENAKLKIDGDRLIVFPESDTFSLFYNKPVNIKSPTKFDIKLLIVIAVLSFLAAYKLTSYLADFKTLNNASRMDIVFLLIFFIIVFIPMSNIDKKTVNSEKENRKLAEFKPFIYKNSINFNFGNDFDNWFSDRFFLRNYITESFSKLKILSNKQYKNSFGLKGKDNWLFYANDNSERNYLNLDKFSEKELHSVVDYIVSIDKYCKKRNKKFVFVICPDKNKIYGEYYPDYYIKNIPDSQSRANQLVSALKKKNIDVVYPYNTLHKNKTSDPSKLLYWKNDTHWSKYGAYLAYKEDIAKHLGVVPVKVSFDTTETHSGDISNHMPIKYNDDTQYINPDVIQPTAICSKHTNKKHNKNRNREDVICINKNKVNKNVLFYRDSFSGNLIPYVSENFNNSEFYWTPKVDTKEIDKANIVVLEKVERCLREFINLTPLKE